MIKIIYPTIKPTIKTKNGLEFIFCIVRKRWFKITPEEWVRQNFLLYLHYQLGFSLKLISVEKQITLPDLKKRFDIVVYKNSIPYIIVECKEMNVPLSDNTFSQVLNYNSIIKAPYIVITNGSYCRGYFMEKDGFYELNELPNAEM